MRFLCRVAIAAALSCLPGLALAEEEGQSTAAHARGNRLTYLNGVDPYYVGRNSPRLTTPQWLGEPDVEAVVILAVHAADGPKSCESFWRPMVDRLKQIDKRAALSIMTNPVDPADPWLQGLLREGISLEYQPADAARPLLGADGLANARSNYEQALDRLNSVLNNHAVAFRLPGCESLNVASPRFFAEIFNQRTPQGGFLTIDSSVVQTATPNDPQLPRELVLDADGGARFDKYLPPSASENTLADYPYPYVIGGLCWEFPATFACGSQQRGSQQSNTSPTLDDLQAALEVAVCKQGVFCLGLQPDGGIRADQITGLIDYAVARFGRKVRFLNFREVADRLQQHLLGGQALRAADGTDNGVRLIDLNDDGFLDVVIGNAQVRETRLWSPHDQRWVIATFPRSLVSSNEPSSPRSASGQFGIVGQSVSLIIRDEQGAGGWRFEADRWIERPELLAGLVLDGRPMATAQAGSDRGVRLRDLDADGQCELLVSNPEQNVVFAWRNGWQPLAFALPGAACLVDAAGRDNGVRFVDVDEDFRDDLLFSNERAQGLYLFDSLANGWNRQVFALPRSEGDRLPMVSRSGTDNGSWFRARQLLVQNEATARLPDQVDRRSWNELLEGTPPQAKSPAAALASITLRPGFTVELVAAEPLVEDPIAFDWGPDGRLWVVEMGDYPTGVGDKRADGGRVRCLVDSDGDGRYDRSTVFLEGLRYPTSVLSWRGGVLVTAAPDLLYAEDTDGDGRADRREVLFTGFAKGNPQHVVNGLNLGIDNWIYGANGDTGGKIQSSQGGEPVSIGGRDFRCRPDDGRFEAQAGYSQFVRSQDDWGNWFGSSNNNPMWQYVLEDHYLRRNPHFTPPDGRWTIADVPGQSPVYPVSRMLERFNDPHTANCFTSACSAIIYRDDLFGTAFAGNSFVSEPVHNLVHREVLVPDGVRFRSHRAADELRSEFLASTDSFFRPTMIRTGPDGALWIADMYRLVIEHPEWIPPVMRSRWDLRAGSDRGRIYRVVPVGATPWPIPRLDQASPLELVALLESSNGWIRDKVQQLLIASPDPIATKALKELARSGSRPTARLHALCTLEGLGVVEIADVRGCLADSHPGVRRHAVRIAEAFVAGDEPLVEQMASLVGDPDPRVRLQLAYSLGACPGAVAGKALGKLALNDASDTYTSAAAMSSVLPHLAAVARVIAEESRDRAPPAAFLANLVAVAAAIPHPEAMHTLIPVVAADQQGSYAPWQFEAVAELLDTLDRRSTSLAEFQAKSPESLRPEIARLAGLFSFARGVAADSSATPVARGQAIRLLGRGSQGVADDLQRLAVLLGPSEPPEVQRAAIAELGRLRSDQVPNMLLAHWESYGPGMQGNVLDILFSREAWLAACLEAIESDHLSSAAIDATHRQQLVEHRTPAVRQRAAKLFAQNLVDRQHLLDEYRGAAPATGNADRGLQVFGKRCAVCHRVGEAGHAVGPDLAALTDRTTEALLVAILDPNRAIEAKYLNYAAATADGLTYSGLISAETGTSVTLVGQEAKQQVLLRSNLESLASSGKSLMPEGFEKDITPVEMADLIAYVQTIGRRAKSMPGNQPQIVEPEPLRRQVFCLASNCEIYGTTLRLEEVNAALGYWNSADDQAVWTIEIPRAMRYAVLLELACPADAAGNTWLVEIGDYRLTGTVQPTANWNTYQRQKAGEIRLEAGRHRLGVRAQGPIRDALFDLKGVVLIPLPGG